MSTQPNAYELNGGNIKFSYEKHNFLFRGSFVTYQDGGGQPQRFRGSAVRVLETGIGTLVTVTVHVAIQKGFGEFSVLIPEIELADTTSQEKFETDGISTQIVVGLPGSSAVNERYKFIPMTGVAYYEVPVRPPVAVVGKAG
jgi:hypothetical protein